MKSLQELMTEALITEKNVSIDADVIFKGGKKEQEKMEQKFGIKFKFKRGNECDITGPKDKVKKYILSPDGYNLDKLDAEDMFPELFESVERDNLTEALKFKDEPADDYRALYTEYAKRLMKIAKDTVADAKNGNTDTFLDSLITKLKNANIAASIILDYNSGQIGDDEKAFNKVKSYVEKV